MFAFQPGRFTGWGSEGVNISHEEILPRKCAQESHDNKSQNPKPLILIIHGSRLGTLWVVVADILISHKWSVL